MPSHNLGRSRRNILGRVEALRILDPHIDDFVLALNEGIQHFNNTPAEQMIPYRKRTKANMLNDAIVAAAKARFDQVARVKVDDDFDSTFFVFDGSLGLRLKKIDQGDQTKNIGTKRQQDVSYQVQELAGIQGLTLVSLGYRLNEPWTEIRGAKVICRFGRSIEWTIPLFDSSASGRVVPLIQITDEQFHEKQDQETSDGEAIVRSKRTKRRDERA